MTRKVTSISKMGNTEPFGLQVKQGDVGFHKHIHKFGYNAAVTTTDSPVWGGAAGDYPYLSSSTILYISSDSTDDTSAGTGARTATVYGLDSSWNEKEITVTLNGYTGVQLGASWRRVYRVNVITAGTGGSNAGVLYVGDDSGTLNNNGVPATDTFARVEVGENATQMAIWTVPAGYTAYLEQCAVASGSSSGKFCIFSLAYRPFSEVFRVHHKKIINTGSLVRTLDYPLVFTEKTDIEMRAVADSGGGTIQASASMSLVYVRNGTELG